MLSSLTIKNYALISDLEVQFSKGFSVLTGETGAGKSIILGALSLVLGQRADVRSIKQGESKCLVEAVFDISPYHLQDFFNERDLEYDEKHCILRRELYDSGKSRAFINDSPVGINDLRELGSRLIDVHSQHQNLDLANGKFQMQVLDALAKNTGLKEIYSSEFKVWQALRKKIQQLQEESKKSVEELDYLSFQYRQLEDAKLDPDEQSLLENESETLSHVEEIKTGLYQVEQILSGDEGGVVLALKNVAHISATLCKIYPDAAGITERLNSVYLDMKDLLLEISNRQEKIEYNPERLLQVNERLDLIYSLQQKHKMNTVGELIEWRDSLRTKISAVENLDEELDRLQKDLDASFLRLANMAGDLSKSRKKAADYLEEKLVETVSVLGMPNMKFGCELTPKEVPDESGGDQIQFLFSANKNIPLKPVSDIASGGEIARLMLGIKTLIAGAIALPAIIFDEIDTGVSGEVADRMAGIMEDMGNLMQVITITHLPQIAAKGNAHYFVYKEDINDVTETRIRRLTTEERVIEIAQMLSGAELSDAARENAKNLLKI